MSTDLKAAIATLAILSLATMSLGSSVGEQESIALTIYNNNFAMVKDVREIEFSEG